MALALLAVLLGLLCAGAAVSVRHQGEEGYTLSYGDHREAFLEWKTQFGHMNTQNWDEEARFTIFSQNVAQIEEHNLLYHTDQSTFYMGTNQFSAMTIEEYMRYTNYEQQSIRKKRENKEEHKFDCQDLSLANVSLDSIPESVNYTELGYVTPAKNQAQCKTCSVFSAIGALEGAYFKSHGVLKSFSEQQIMSCCKDDDCPKCNKSGWASAVFKYIHNAGGIASEEDFQYHDITPFPCILNEVKINEGNLTECYRIRPEGDEESLMKAVALHGPVTADIDANFHSFKSYKGGIFYSKECGKQNRNHSLLVTGYGTLNGTDYWILKNSWSIGWGTDGFMLLARNRNNHCKVADLNYFPIFS